MTKVPNIEIEQIGSDEFWVRYDKRDWLVWTKSPRWIEIEVGDDVKTVGEMHYGPISTFYAKYVLRNSSLPANHGKKWIKGDIDKLYELIEEDIAIEQIARQLGRSAGSVIAKTSSLLGFKFEHVDISRDLGELRFSTLVDQNILDLNREVDK